MIRLRDSFELMIKRILLQQSKYFSLKFQNIMKIFKDYFDDVTRNVRKTSIISNILSLLRIHDATFDSFIFDFEALICLN